MIKRTFFILFLICGCSRMGLGQVEKKNLRFKPLFLLNNIDDGFIKLNKIDFPKQAKYSIDQLPIFCKIEEKLFRNSQTNVKIRLGSVDYVDRLEGKR